LRNRHQPGPLLIAAAPNRIGNQLKRPWGNAIVLRIGPPFPLALSNQ
jgi:hypothetical protein